MLTARAGSLEGRQPGSQASRPAGRQDGSPASEQARRKAGRRIVDWLVGRPARQQANGQARRAGQAVGRPANRRAGRQTSRQPGSQAGSPQGSQAAIQPTARQATREGARKQGVQARRQGFLLTRPFARGCHSVLRDISENCGNDCGICYCLGCDIERPGATAGWQVTLAIELR